MTAIKRLKVRAIGARSATKRPQTFTLLQPPKSRSRVRNSIATSASVRFARFDARFVRLDASQRQLFSKQVSPQKTSVYSHGSSATRVSILRQTVSAPTKPTFLLNQRHLQI